MQQEINYLQQLLATLRTRLLVMAASVGIALEEAGKALAANDPGRATAVMENDAAIDALENEIDEMALQLLARPQPWPAICALWSAPCAWWWTWSASATKP